MGRLREALDRNPTLRHTYECFKVGRVRPSRGQPSTNEFPNVKRIADAVMKRPSVQLVYGQ